MKKVYNIPQVIVVPIRSTRDMMLFGEASMPSDNFTNDAPERKKVF